MVSFLSSFDDSYVYSEVDERTAALTLYALADALDPMWRMKCYRNQHSTQRLPAKPEAKPAPHGIMAVTVADWRLGAWK